MTRERQYLIPGFPPYYIDDRGKVVSRRTGRPIALTKHPGRPNIEIFSHGRKYRRLVENLQPKCLNNSCHRPRIPGDELGLCRHHRDDLTHGRHRAYPDPSVREYSIEEANNIVEAFIEVKKLPENCSGRRLAREMGITKDLLWHIRHRTFPTVKSEAFEAINNALATAMWEASIVPKCSNSPDPKR